METNGSGAAPRQHYQRARYNGRPGGPACACSPSQFCRSSSPPRARGAESLLYCSKAESAQHAGKHESAINCWTRCINRDDLTPANLAIAHYNRGIARQAQGQDDLAARDYGEAIRLDPNLARTHKNHTASLTPTFGFLADLNFLPGFGSAQSYYDRGDAKSRNRG